MEPLVPVLAIPLRSHRLMLPRTSTTLPGCWQARRKQRGKPTRRLRMDGKKKYHMCLVQHELDKLESLYFLCTPLEDGSVWLCAVGSLPRAIGQCGYGQVRSSACSAGQRLCGGSSGGRCSPAAAGPCPAPGSHDDSRCRVSRQCSIAEHSGYCYLFPLPEAGTARGDGNGRVTHQLENSREGPALPPPRRGAEGILEIKQYYVASHCWEMFILEMELLLPSPPRRSRELPVTPHLGARSTHPALTRRAPPAARPGSRPAEPGDSPGARSKEGRRSLWVPMGT